MAKKKITDIAVEVLEPFLDEHDISLYHAEYVKEGPDKILRIYIDRDSEGITTDDCELVSRFLSDRLDELDPIPDNYLLEVSSPGMDRELITAEHFNRYVGEPVVVSLYKEMDGQKQYEGILKSFDGEKISLELETGDPREFSKRDVAKTNLAVII